MVMGVKRNRVMGDPLESVGDLCLKSELSLLIRREILPQSVVLSGLRRGAGHFRQAYAHGPTTMTTLRGLGRGLGRWAEYQTRQKSLFQEHIV